MSNKAFKAYQQTSVTTAKPDKVLTLKSIFFRVATFDYNKSIKHIQGMFN